MFSIQWYLVPKVHENHYDSNHYRKSYQGHPKIDGAESIVTCTQFDHEIVCYVRLVNFIKREMNKKLSLLKNCIV